MDNEPLLRAMRWAAILAVPLVGMLLLGKLASAIF
jgi:hypothetical protein